MYGYYYKAGKTWEDVKLWEATKDNPQEDINVESFLEQDNYWNIGSFKELAKEMQLVLKADYSFPVILDEEYKLVDGAHRLVHAYIDGKTHIKGVIIKNNQWPEPDYDENKECQNTWKLSQEQLEADLEKEIDDYLEPIKAWQIQEAPFTSMENCARHFAKWGRKQVLQEIYDGKVKPVDKITAAWIDDESKAKEE